MATTEHFYTGNGSTTTFAFTFPYLANSDVKVEVDNVLKTENSSGLTNNDYSISSTNIVFNSAPASATNVHIYRDTDVDTAQAVYAAGSSIRAVDLNNNQTQVLYSTQEAQTQLIRTSDIKDGAVTSVKIADGTIATVDLANNAVTTAKIANDAVTNTKIANDSLSTHKYSDNSITTSKLQDAQITTAKLANNAVTTAKIAADAITNAKIADNAIATEHIEASGVRNANIQNSAVTTAKIANDAVTTAKIGTGAVTTAKIAADAITGAKIANDQINSEHYVDGSIDTAHIADAQITTAKLVNNSVTSAILANDAVTNIKIADDSIDSEHYVDGSIDTAHIANNAVTTAKIAADSITNAKIADDAIATEHIETNGVRTDNIQSQAVTATKLSQGAVTTDKIAGTAVTDVKLASNSVTTSKITDANVTTVKIADSNVTLAKLAGDLKRTTITNSDAQIPTSGAVVDYVAAQLAPIGGLEVIATDAAFPDAMPAAGVVISIADAGGLVVNGSGTSTTGRTANGSTVTINNINSAFNSTTVDPGVSFMVSSTGANQVYNFHKATLKEADILSLSGDINDFAERYRVSADPDNLPNKDEGDLVYDTNADAMKVYDSTTSSWKEVTSTGEFKYLFLTGVGTSGAPTLNGSISQYDLRVGSNTGPAATVTSAAQLIVSINGVVQKANSGTSAPSEGFAMVDSNTIIFGSALQTGDSVFIVQIGSSINLPNPGDGTVTAAKIASGAVTTAKIADDAVTGAKVAANLDIPDNNKIRFGTGNDLSIYHTGSLSLIDNTEGNLHIRNQASSGQIKLQPKSGEDGINVVQDGAVELYHNNAKKFETASYGCLVTGNLGFTDGDKAVFGVGSDLQLYHSNNSSYITNSTGNLFFLADEIRFNNNANNEAKVRMFNNGAVELYYDNDVKFGTGAVGVYSKSIMPSSHATYDIGQNMGRWNNIYIADNGKLRLGQSDDLQIYHDGSRSNIADTGTGGLHIYTDTLRIRNAANTESIIKGNENGNVELYYDNSKKFETSSSGATVTGTLAATNTNITSQMYMPDNGQIRLGNSDDLIISHNGSDSIINDQGTGQLKLQVGGSTKFNTQSGGVQFYGSLYADDNNKIELGNDQDLEIFHNANGHSYIKNKSGNLYIMANNTDVGIQVNPNDDVRLRYNDSNKVITTSWGATIGGSISSNVISGLSNYQFYTGFDAGSTSTFGGVVMGSGPNGNSPFVAASKAGNGSALHLRLTTNGSTRMLIQDNGNIGAPSGTNIYNASDSRLKKNVTTLDKGLETIKSLRPVSFNWIDGFCDVEKDPLYGFIAQEVETVDSNLVSSFGDDVEIGDDPNNPDQVITDPLRVNEKFIIPMLVKAVQELSAKVAALEAK